MNDKNAVLPFTVIFEQVLTPLPEVHAEPSRTSKIIEHQLKSRSLFLQKALS